MLTRFAISNLKVIANVTIRRYNENFSKLIVELSNFNKGDNMLTVLGGSKQ